jgi:high-affinity iron transporter
VWYFENNAWNKVIGGDAAETGSGAGSYNIHKSVWHVNCCNPEINGGGGWGIFNSLFGWTNSATYGSVISYNLYWLAVIVAFLAMRTYEKKGHWPFMKPNPKDFEDVDAEKDSTGGSDGVVTDDTVGIKGEGEIGQTSNVREIAV